jgi:hypothetical protein
MRHDFFLWEPTNKLASTQHCTNRTIAAIALPNVMCSLFDCRVSLGWYFLFSGIYFLDEKMFLPGFLRISFFLHFPEDFFTGTWFWRGSLEFLFFSFLQEFFAVIPVGHELLYLPRIPPDSCSRQKLSGLGQRLKKALC